VKALSKNVVEEVSSLSDRYSEIITSLSDRIATLEATSVVIKQDLEKQNVEMKKMGGSKVDKTSLGRMEEQTAETIKTLEGLRNELNDQRLAVENLNKALEEEMAGLVQTVEGVSGRRKKLDSTIENLSESKLDKKTFDDFLKKEQVNYESKVTPLKQDIDSLKAGVRQLQEQVNMLGRSVRLMEAEKSLLERRPAEQKGGSGPGKIIEQEISQ
jgi:chromosome segregation ATPase